MGCDHESRTKKYFKLSEEIEKEYLKKYGDNSLDRVVRVIYEPGVNEKEFLEDLNNLKDSVASGVQLEQIEEKDWKKIIF